MFFTYLLSWNKRTFVAKMSSLLSFVFVLWMSSGMCMSGCCFQSSVFMHQIFFFSYRSSSLADRWGTTVDFTTSFLHSSRFSAFRRMTFHSRPVHSFMLCSHRFFCLPLRLPPWTVPCWTVLASPDDRVTCPYHFSLRLFTLIRKSRLVGSTASTVLKVTKTRHSKSKNANNPQIQF